MNAGLLVHLGATRVVDGEPGRESCAVVAPQRRTLVLPASWILVHLGALLLLHSLPNQLSLSDALRLVNRFTLS